MIDKNNIKESGLLEQYILGDMTLHEKNEIEVLLANDSELRNYVLELEEELEKVAFENAVNPPAEVKDGLMKTIASDTPKRSNFYTYAASVAAAIFLLSSFWLFNQWQKEQSANEAINEELVEIKGEIDVLIEKLDETASLAEIIKNPDTAPFLVKGNEKVAFNNVVAYVNHKKKEVVINAQKLPELPKDKSYQMWGDVDGEMIDMGVINLEKDYLAMNYIDEATSINITIEPAGGNDHATVENLVANVFL